MGSLIAYEVLTFYKLKLRINTLITIGSPLGLPFVLSKIGIRMNKLEESSVLPTPHQIEKKWYNFSDIEDVIAFNYKLGEEYEKNKNGVKPIDVLVVNNYKINGKENHHKSFGYLRALELAKVINDFISDKQLNLIQKALMTIKDIVTVSKK